MLYCNLWGLLVLLGLLVVSGENLSGFYYILQAENLPFLNYLMLFSLCSALGQLVIFYTVHTFGFGDSFVVVQLFTNQMPHYLGMSYVLISGCTFLDNLIPYCPLIRI